MNEPDLRAIRAILATARAQGRDILSEPEGIALLDALGVAIPTWRLVADEAAVDGELLAALPGERVVVKAVAPGLAHKTEHGAVAFPVRTVEAVRAAMAAMRVRLPSPPTGFTVTELVAHDRDPGGELLLSFRWTDDLGPVAAVGAGGVATEFLAADLRPGRELAVVSAALTPPEGMERALAQATAVRLATRSVRGQQPRLAPERLADAVRRLLALAPLAPDELAELEINPAAVTPDGLVALDVLVRLGGGPRPVRPPRPAAAVARLLAPRSIAIVGVSSGTNPGRVILQNVLREGFDPSAITVIKPGVEQIDGVRCVPDLASLPARVDLLVVVLPAAATPGFVAEAVERDLAVSLIVIPGGLEEKSGGGPLAARMRESLAASRARPDGGPVINGGNCLGIRSRPGRYDTLFIPQAKLPPGSIPMPIALVTGSGAFAITRLSRLAPLDPRYVITIGNQTDLTAGDYLASLADDPEVRVVGVYVEGFVRLDGLRFLEAAARLRADGRSVVLYRAGRTAAGAGASASHTAAIAGDAMITRALARQVGVTWAETPAEFDDLLRSFALLDRRPSAGRWLGAATNAGSECVTIADHAGPLALARFSAATERLLADLLVPAGITSVVDVRNPLDLTPIADAHTVCEAMRGILAADEVDAGILGLVPMTDTLDTLPRGEGHGEDLDRPGGLVDAVAELGRTTTKPWIAVVDAGPLYDPFRERLTAAGIPVLGTADAATRVLAAWCDASITEG
ncbi:MAG: acetate--CoA ligase family protein [Candidatus Limnocylindrales bacterium]